MGKPHRMGHEYHPSLKMDMEHHLQILNVDIDNNVFK